MLPEGMALLSIIEASAKFEVKIENIWSEG
jgi:hypothetical protein